MEAAVNLDVINLIATTLETGLGLAVSHRRFVVYTESATWSNSAKVHAPLFRVASLKLEVSGGLTVQADRRRWSSVVRDKPGTITPSRRLSEYGVRLTHM
jgi:hypothetical protein